MTSKFCPKVGIYFAHYECYGHTSIVTAIGEVYKKRFPSGNLFFIQAGLDQPKAKIDRLGKVFTLPNAFVSRRNFRELNQGVSSEVSKRSAIFTEILKRENPNLLITEFFPLGWEECRHELIPSLVRCASQDTALWAISGHPLVAGSNFEWREKILKLYQKIIILCPVLEKKFFAEFHVRKNERQRYLDFFKRNEDKIIFAGYHLPKNDVVYDDEDKNIIKPSVPKNACRVTVVRGGGAYYPKIIAEAIVSSDLLGPEYYLTVIAGPATTIKEWYFFSTLVSKKKIKNLVLLKSVGNYEEAIATSDVCVSVASYNSATMILKHRKKAVLIPFVGYEEVSFIEQPARAAMLKEILGSQILNIGELTARTLANKIRTASNSRSSKPRIPAKWFSGGKFLDAKMAELLNPKVN